MIDLFQMNDDQVIDWLLDQAGLKRAATLETYPGTAKLHKIVVGPADVEAEIDEDGVMVVRQRGQEVLRVKAWVFL